MIEEFDENGMSLYSGIYPNSNGGTETVFRRLMANLSDEQKSQYQIICSRVRHIDPDKKSILWLHDHVTDPETARLQFPDFRNQFHKLVFVSNAQRMTYTYRYNIPLHEGVVIPNMVEPFGVFSKPDISPLRIIYHTTPHRGLALLIPLLQRLDDRGIDYVADIYSSFSIYGWSVRDEPYKELFEQLKKNPRVTYHGARPNDEVREALKQAHIFYYPCVFPETSCIAAIEAQMAGCLVVCPDYEALVETVWPSLSSKFELHSDHYLELADKAFMKGLEKLILKGGLDNKDFIDYYSVKSNMSLWNRLLV